jgi:uncharacterized protein with gpF-like domain
LYNKIQEIGKKVEDYRTNAVQEALVPEQINILNLQHEYDHLKGQKEMIKLGKENLEGKLEESKTEISKELQKQSEFFQAWRK